MSRHFMAPSVTTDGPPPTPTGPHPPCSADGYPHTYTLYSTHPIQSFKQLFAPPYPIFFFACPTKHCKFIQ